MCVCVNIGLASHNNHGKSSTCGSLIKEALKNKGIKQSKGQRNFCKNMCGMRKVGSKCLGFAEIVREALINLSSSSMTMWCQG